MSWAETYTSLSALKSNSDLSVVGTFAKELGETVDGKGIAYTDYAFTVDSVAYNPRNSNIRVGASLRIHQTGGVVGKVIQQISDDPRFRLGEHAALFLRQYKPGFYFVVGGPTGRFVVSEKGVVTPFSSTGPTFSGSIRSFTTSVATS